MKYSPVNNRTFGPNPSPEGEDTSLDILAAVSEGYNPKNTPETSVAQMLKNPRLNWAQTTPPSFEVYGCPVCKEVYFSKEKAEHCADPERAFALKFGQVKVGDWLKFHKDKEHPLDRWGLPDTNETIFVQVTALSFCYDGFRCGKLLTLHFKGSYLNASDEIWLSYWSVASEEEQQQAENSQA